MVKVIAFCTRYVDVSQLEILKEAQKSPDIKVVGVDRGAHYLANKGYAMDLAVGDFDSVSEEEFEQLKTNSQEMIILPCEKDETDSEAALDAIMKRWPDAESYFLYGALGGRLDHSLNNLWLVLQERFWSIRGRLHLIDGKNVVSFLEPGHHELVAREGMTYFSLISFGAVKGVNLSQCKYTLKNFSSDFPRSFISNEFLPEFLHSVVDFEEGLFIFIQSKD